MSWKRTVRRLIERTLDIHVVHRTQVALVFEREHLRRFFEHFKVDCVFDVGANAGQYAKMLRQEVNFTGAIISYEPMPEHAQQLRESAKSAKAWYIEEAALDTREGTATFNVFSGDQFSSLHTASETAKKLFETHTKLSRTIEVRTATVAGELAKYRSKLGFQRPFLKMDTQGHDISVAMGAGESLREFVGLQSELAVERLYVESPGFEEALKFYSSKGFELSALVPNNLGHFPRLLELDCIMFRR